METNLGAELAIVGRLLLAAVLGAVIGLEREIHDHPAGMRTHLIVAIGSATFTILSIEAFKAPGADPARVAAQVVAGVGFLGAGAILKEGATVRGLTTAASLWTVSAVGMASGTGSWVIATTVTVVVVFSLWPLRLVAARVVGRTPHRFRIKLLLADPHRLGDVLAAVDAQDASVAQLTTDQAPGGGLVVELEARVRSTAAAAELMVGLGNLEGVDLVGSAAQAN